MACRTQKCWDQIMHCCKTAPPHYCCKTAVAANSSTPLLLQNTSTHPTTAAAKHHGTPQTKPKKLASTVTPLQNNWNPLQKRVCFYMLSEAIYGEAELKDLSEPCIPRNKNRALGSFKTCVVVKQKLQQSISPFFVHVSLLPEAFSC